MPTFCGAKLIARISTALIALVFIASCQQASGPGLDVRDVEILAPLPGSNAAVAYFSLTNNTDVRLTVKRVSSPQFASVEVHETTISNGIARMAKIDRVDIDPGASVEFSSGGKHLMLMQPADSAGADRSVTLEFHYGTGGISIVTASMQPR